MFIGTWFAGRTIDSLTVGGVPDWDKIWYVPTAIAAIVLVIFVFLFKEKKKSVSTQN
jgi:phosphotransferase system  glucose/maltose/N-acetylglucosamine-specific IIC component